MNSIKENENSHINGLTLITSHINADFDAVASMLAAQKLYTDSIVVLPGLQGKTLRNFFINSMMYLFNSVDISNIDMSQVKRIVLVDTRQKNRIGKLASLLENKQLEIHIYDHHPAMENDIHATVDIYKPIGATITILTQILQEKKIPISSDEATIMCLGIYEDTGSFTFSSTTEQDFSAAAYLVSKGADINTISNMITQEISPQQISILNDMIQSSMVHKINGVEIVITIISTFNYVKDFAWLVHKMVKMENIDALIALARMGNKIYMVGRSRITEVDVSNILKHFGGGGHAYAAAATIKEKTLTQIEQELLEILYREIIPKRLAHNLMSSPVIFIHPELTCKEATKILTQYNLNTLLVLTSEENQHVVHGYISRRVLEKALHHNLGQVSVNAYMTTDIDSIDYNADLPEIQKFVIEQKQRILPVVKDNQVVGVITRTDILHVLFQNSSNNKGDFPDPINKSLLARTKNIVNIMKERLSKRIIDLLQSIGQVSDDIGYPVYVVGGFVRDLLLYRPNEDIDIVVEGNGIQFAKEYAKKFNARVHTHIKFCTAVIILPDEFKIDVASARMEYYQSPGALPIVEMSSIKFDLFRRDFTINTLAIQINSCKFGTLIDFFSAQRDLKDKVLRVLHNLSFVEDPTRIFRALRFEQRFSFSIGKLTSSLIENAVKMDFLKRLSGNRVFTELRLILEEENPVPILTRLFDYDLLKNVHPSLVPEKRMIQTFESIRKVLTWHDLLFWEEPYEKWLVYFMALIRNCNTQTTKEICDRLRLPPRYLNILGKSRIKSQATLCWLEKFFPVKNNELYERLNGFKSEHILYMMASSRWIKVKRAISLFYTKLRYYTVSIKGEDIKSMGIKPGPVFRELLQAVLAAKLNDEIKHPDQELELLKKYVQKIL
ncbi:MAG: CBS domain-containing protein [Desulfobacterales bacterium]|nr:CBS domain-containing protein [Desulfobacterales bacterium]